MMLEKGMFRSTIEMVQSEELRGVCREVEIVKGRYWLPSRFKKLIYLLRRQVQWQRKYSLK